MQKIRLISDTHLDFDIEQFHRSRGTLSPDIKKSGEMAFLWTPKAMLDDKNTILVIAGDIWTSRKYLTNIFGGHTSWLAKIAPQFKAVVMVLGNHDYWGANISDEVKKTKLEIKNQNLDNVYLLENNTILLGEIKFIGATLWTDYNDHNQLLMREAPSLMNDYKKIRYGSVYKKVSPANIHGIHIASKNYIFNNAVKDYKEQKLIVVTHMPPSEQSLEKKYRDNPQPINYLYYSNLEEKIQKSEIDLWMHGHTHNFSDYKIGNTRVLSNPRGYTPHVSEGYDDYFRLEV